MAEVFDHFVVSVIERLSATDESCSSSPMLCTPVGVPRIGFWVGPFGARHDMRCGSATVEVETIRSYTGHRVTIRGEDQLLAPEQGVSNRLTRRCELA